MQEGQGTADGWAKGLAQQQGQQPTAPSSATMAPTAVYVEQAALQRAQELRQGGDKAAHGAPQPGVKRYFRQAAGERWEDPSLAEWPDETSGSLSATSVTRSTMKSCTECLLLTTARKPSSVLSLSPSPPVSFGGFRSGGGLWRGFVSCDLTYNMPLQDRYGTSIPSGAKGYGFVSSQIPWTLPMR